MYGLPTIHKPNGPLSPILSMIGSAQHEMAKWLSEVFYPVIQNIQIIGSRNSYSFAEFMQNLNLENETSFMCSFDISSLFTNVPIVSPSKYVPVLCTGARLIAHHSQRKYSLN